MEFTTLELVLLPIGLGLLGIVELCTIGGHILAPKESDSIQTVTMVIKTGMTYQELGAMIFP